MNNDLISREALKKKIEEVQYTQEFCIEHQIDYSISMQMLGMVIDNAPTVDIKDEIAGAYNEGYMCGNKEAEKKERKGEWIYLNKDEPMTVECPFCHERQCCISNYCDNCGADMRKGGKE